MVVDRGSRGACGARRHGPALAQPRGEDPYELCRGRRRHDQREIECRSRFRIDCRAPLDRRAWRREAATPVAARPPRSVRVGRSPRRRGGARVEPDLEQEPRLVGVAQCSTRCQSLPRRVVPAWESSGAPSTGGSGSSPSRPSSRSWRSHHRQPDLADQRALPNRGASRRGGDRHRPRRGRQGPRRAARRGGDGRNRHAGRRRAARPVVVADPPDRTERCRLGPSGRPLVVRLGRRLRAPAAAPPGSTRAARSSSPPLGPGVRRVVLDGRVREAEAVGGRLLRSGDEDRRNHDDLTVGGGSRATGRRARRALAPALGPATLTPVNGLRRQGGRARRVPSYACCDDEARDRQLR